MTKRAFFGIATLLLIAPSALSHSPARAELACVATDRHLAYECTVRIADLASGQAVEGLKVEVKAGMPSMPMAHNIPPVMARPTGEPGVYAFPVKLDMFGNWAFSIRLSGPRDDLLVEVLGFSAGQAHTGHPGAGGKSGHSGHTGAHGDSAPATSH